MRIVSFAGSYRGESSRTKRASDMLADHVIGKAAEEGVDVSYECITADQLRIEHCRGCASCFKKGICPLDETDDMPVLKQKLLDADVIFMCTPVYLWEMSGITKTVLDRLSYWSHCFELAGKVCVTIASTDTSSEQSLEERMKTYMRFMGLTVTDGITAKNYAPTNINRADEIGPVMDAAAERVLAAYRDPAPFIPEIQEIMWKSRLRIIKEAQVLEEIAGIEPPYEIKVCKERSMTDYRSMAEYVAGIKGSVMEDK